MFFPRSFPWLTTGLLIAVAVLWTAANLPAQNVAITREGPYWVRTATGTIPDTSRSRLEVMTRGRVVLRGGSVQGVSYRLVEKVRAGTEEEAQRLLGGVSVSATGFGNVLRVVIVPSSSQRVFTGLELSVPRQMAGAVLQTDIGDVEAYDFDGNIQMVTLGGLIRSDRIGGSLAGRTGAGEIRLGKIGGSVRCLSGGGSIYVDSVGGDANCQTAGGDVNVREATGPLVLSTEGGNVHVDKAGSSVEAHSAEGIVEVTQAGGAVIADTRVGSIQVGASRGVRCESASGGVRVRTQAGPVNVSTAIGAIVAELLAGGRIEDSSLVAGSGDITVLIPSNLSLSVMARNDSGSAPRIVSDFSGIRASNAGLFTSPRVAQGSINGGGPVLHINTEGGTIYLRRSK